MKKKDICKEIDENRSTIYSKKQFNSRKKNLRKLEDFVNNIGNKVKFLEGEGTIQYVTQAHAIPKIRKEVSFVTIKKNDGNFIEIVDLDKPSLL